MIDDNGLAIPEGEEPINEMKREALTTKIAGLQNIASLETSESKYTALVNDLLDLIPVCYYHAALAKVNVTITEQLRLMAEDAERYRWAIEVCENSGTLDSIVLCHEGDESKIRERTDSYIIDQAVGDHNGDTACANWHSAGSCDCAAVCEGAYVRPVAKAPKEGV
jgi:hypothetical protein